jgi:arylformamidase
MDATVPIRGKYYDLSNPVWEGMPCYPANSPAQIEQVSSLEKGGFNVHRIRIATHQGTHVDAPRHLFNRGSALEELDLSTFIGEATVLDLSFKELGSGISAEDLEKFADQVRPGDIVILYTGCSEYLADPRLNANYTYVDRSAAEWLVAKKVKTVGIDFFSVDQYGDRANPAHNVLLGNGIPIIEEISSAAKHLCGKRIYLICLPLRIMAGDGAPARAIAYLLD